jgi:hypothetical protein
MNQNAIHTNGATTLRLLRAPEIDADATLEMDSGVRLRLADAPKPDPTPAKPGKKPLVDTLKLNKLIVSAYKFMGFAILGVILFGLGSYIATHIFFYVSTSWVEPTVLSPTDPRVLQLASQHAQESGHRDALVGQRLELSSRLRDAQRIAATEEAFQASFKLAMAGDLSDRKSQLAHFRGLLGRYHATRKEISQNSRAFTDVTKNRIAGEYEARVIDREQMVAGQFQLSQVAGADLSLAERNLEVDTRVQALRREVESLDAVTAGDPHANTSKITYDVLRIVHEFDRSVLDRKRALDDAEALGQSIAQLSRTIDGYDHLLKSIEESPFMLAADKNETVAFVPYDNVSAATAGSTVYACRLGFVVCRKVGSIAKALDGETEGKHPLHNKDLRGTTVVLRLDDKAAASQAVLHVGRAPLFL